MVRAKNKKGMWDKWVEEAESNEAMWGVWRLTRKNRFAKTPTLRKGNVRAVTLADKERILRQKLFPKETDNDEERSGMEGEKVNVTIEQVKRAFRGMRGMKAPGQDKIIVKVIKETGEVLGEGIRETYQLAINNGQHTRRWKTAIAAILPKPQKADYADPGSYRPVSLLNPMGKDLEKVVAQIITAKAERNERQGFHRDQRGERQGSASVVCVQTTLA